MKSYRTLYIAVAVALLAATVPAVSFAQGNGGHGNSNDRGHSFFGWFQNTADNVGYGIGNAWGHLIAPGWLKHNGNDNHNGNGSNHDRSHGDGDHDSDDDDNSNSSTTQNTTAPVISNLTATSNLRRAVISWSTDQSTNGIVWYSTSNPVNTSGMNYISNRIFSKNHQIVLTNLKPNTTYYVVVGSANYFGQSTKSGQISFTTTATSTGSNGSSHSTLVLSSVSASITGQNQAQISWNTNNVSSGTVWYSTSSPVNTSSASSVSAGNNIYNHYALLNGLSASTTYYFIVSSTDAYGNTATSSQGSFTTPAGPVVNPLTISNAVAIVGSNSVTLNWTTNESADSQIYYASSSPVTIGATSTTAITDSTMVTSHTMNVTGLATSTTYYMIIRSTDGSGNIQATGQFQFTTGS